MADITTSARRGHPQCEQCGLYKQLQTNNRPCQHPFMDGSGPRHGKADGCVFVIGEAPGYNEDQSGIQFIGDSGQLLREHLEKHKIPMERVRFSNAVRCRPPKNKLHGQKEIRACRTFLEEEIRQVNPSAIMLVGNAPLISVTKKGGISKRRRQLMYYESANGKKIPCVACYHPAYILRNKDLEKEFSRDIEFFARLVVKGARAVNAHSDDYDGVLEINDNPSVKDLNDFYHRVLQNKIAIGFDGEADELEVRIKPDVNVLCVGVSTGGRTKRDTLVLQVDIPKNGSKDNDTIRVEQRDAETQKKLAIMRLIHEDPRITKIGHNAKYDMHLYDVRFGWNVRGVRCDTLLQHSFIKPLPIPHDLDSVATDELNLFKYKHITEQWVKDENNPRLFRDVPYPRLSRRNGIDCFVTAVSAAKMYKRMRKIDQQYEKFAQIKMMKPSETFRDIVMPSLHVTYAMEKVGFKINRAYAEKFAKELRARCVRALEKMRMNPKVQRFEKELFTRFEEDMSLRKRPPTEKQKEAALKKTRFNPNSDPQIAMILFDDNYYGIEPQVFTDSGAPSTNKEHLEAILKMLKKARRRKRIKKKSWCERFIIYLFEYRKCDKGASTFVEGVLDRVDSDDRVHSTFNVGVARTGRLSSSDPNLQNIPKPNEYRRLFCAKNGYTLVAPDYSQIELRVGAAFGEDKVMIDIFKSGGDFHEETARRALGIKKGEEVTPERRRDAKTVNFGIFYGESAESLGKSLGISADEAATLMGQILGKFRGVAQWMARTKMFAKKHGFVFTWSGRRRLIGNATIRETEDRGLLGHAMRQAVNTPIQGTANDICLLAAIAIRKEFRKQKIKGRLVSLVHDQILAEVRDDFIERAKKIMTHAMLVTAMTPFIATGFSCPVTIDMETGPSWGDLISEKHPNEE